jgi:hypothetical protein
MKRKMIANYKLAIERIGCQLVKIEDTRKHVRLYVADHNRTRFFTVPSSTSDWRGFRNWEADLRRWKEGTTQ